MGNAGCPGETKHKTVNIYSLSLSAWQHIVKRLDQCISAGQVNDYYETVFAQLLAEDDLSFDAISFDGKPWYEIDTIQDLAIAEKILLLGDDTCGKTISPSLFDSFHYDVSELPESQEWS